MSAAPTRLAGKVVFVSGAGGDLAAGPGPAADPDPEVGLSNGLAAALCYARAGAAVACVDLRADAAEASAARIRAEGGTAAAIVADVTEDDQVAAAVHRAERQLGPIDVLHNNVGATFLGGPIDIELAQWRKALQVNLDSVLLTVRHVLPGMLERRRGAIVNISSVGALRDVGYDYPAYMAAKAGVNQFTVSVALRGAPFGVRANSVAPGFIDTALVRRQLASQAASLEELLATRHAASPTGRMGTPWDVAHAALFLASDDAAYINGVCLPVDGGLSMRCGS